MSEAITLVKLELSGFRAYLKPQNFILQRRNMPLSLAVFAPNGNGKSSLVDSLEYYFSENGTLERLGQNQSTSKAGHQAVRHVDARRNNEDTFVSLRFRQGNEQFGEQRMFPCALTESGKRIQSLTKVPFVIRGYELRRFIDETSPTKRYQDLVAWLSMEPLLVVQKNLTELKKQVKNMVDDNTDVRERMRDVESITGGNITKWNESEILGWLNENVLASLEKPLQFEKLSDTDPALQELENLAHLEQKRTDPNTLENLLPAIEMLRVHPTMHQDTPTSKITSFEKSITNLEDMALQEAAVKNETSESIFNEIWVVAKKLFDENSEFDKCPVCGTEFANSPSGTRDGVHVNLRVNISKLEKYKMAMEDRKEAETKLEQTKTDLVEALNNLSILAGSVYPHDNIDTYCKSLQSWKNGDSAPDSTDVINELECLYYSVNTYSNNDGQRWEAHMYYHAHETTTQLLKAKVELERIKRTKTELQAIQHNLGQQSEMFDRAITQHIDGLVGKLENEMKSLYQSIQGSNVKVPRIRIKLAKEGAANQRSAQLLIDFNEGWKDAIPSGFLSDSQIHTLALAFRLTAIRIFNDGVKIIALDDIVTSYDAEHRKNIVAVLNKEFDGFQIILVTHDRQFFDFLRDHFGETRWMYKQIKELRDGFGPIFQDHMVRDEMIEAKLNAGENTANDIRQAEEEWLYRICHEFRTPTAFNRNHKPSLNELATSLDMFLKTCGLGSPKISGYSRPFLESLQQANVENQGSHYKNDPHSIPSIGDERTRWEEFKCFRNLFVCKKGHTRFKRPDGLEKPVCAKCGAQFDFEHQTLPTS